MSGPTEEGAAEGRARQPPRLADEGKVEPREHELPEVADAQPAAGAWEVLDDDAPPRSRVGAVSAAGREGTVPTARARNRRARDAESE